MENETKGKRASRTRWGGEGSEKRTIKDHQNKRKREKENAIQNADKSSGTEVTPTITWLFLATKTRPFIFYASAVCGTPSWILVHTWNTSIHLALNFNGNVIASLLKVGNILSLPLSLSLCLFRSSPLHK